MTTEPEARTDFMTALRKRYIADLADQESLFRELLNAVKGRDVSPEERARLRMRVHKLSGNGATFGFPAISRAAAALEVVLDAEPAASRNNIALYLRNLIDALTAVHGSRTPPVPPPSRGAPPKRPAPSNGAGAPIIVPEDKAAAHAPERRDPALRPKVLIVDDDSYARDALLGMLLGVAEIATAANATEALDLMTHSRPDLVLLDVAMPGGMSGLQLLEKMRQSKDLQDVPAIMITASDKSESVLRALKAGAVDYIVKPFDTAKVGERLRTRLLRLSKTVFVVDDDSAICELLARKFAAAGYATKTCADGQTAMARIVEELPDLVILDRMLPDLDGTAVLKHMRDQDIFKDTAVVMLSANCEESDIAAGFGLGATDYFVKPFDPQELAARCIDLLRTRTRAAG